MNCFGCKFIGRQKLFEVHFSNHRNGSLGFTAKVKQSYINFQLGAGYIGTLAICKRYVLNLALIFFCRFCYFRASVVKEMEKQEVNIREVKCLLEKLRTSADTKVFRGSARFVF